MYSYDPRGSRDNVTEHQLGASNVGQVGVAWSFPTPTPVAGTPAVDHGAVFAGDFAGNFYALDESSGALRWKTNVGAPISDSALVTPRGVVVFGDLAGNVWGLDALTGATRWEIHPNTGGGPLVAVWGSPTQVGDDVAIGFASNEEGLTGGGVTYDANGSVALIDPSNGNVVWQTYMIPPGAYADGWRGASVWSTPTYDQATHTLYVTTGNYFQQGNGADPGREDATIALDATTGAIRWADELVKGDIWNGNIVPGPDNPDADLADSAKLFTLPNHEEAVGVGSKDGFYFVMDAATGAPINGPDGTQLEVGGVLGGLYANGAVDQQAGLVFQNGLDWPDLSGPGSGDLYALSLDGKLLWDYKTPAQNGSGVAIANGVVYFQSFDGDLYMLNEYASSADDALLAKVYTGGQYSAPAVADGHIFQGTGPALWYFFGDHSLTGSIVSLGLPQNGAGSAAGAAVSSPASGDAGLLPTAVSDDSVRLPWPTDASPDSVSAGPAEAAWVSVPAGLASPSDGSSLIAALTPVAQSQPAGSRKSPWNALFQATVGLQV